VERSAVSILTGNRLDQTARAGAFGDVGRRVLLRRRLNGWREGGPVRDVVLLLMGAQLAVGSRGFGEDRAQRFITRATAVSSMGNVSLALDLQLTLSQMDRRGRLRLAR
jgi:hypothetical protein